MQHYLLFNVDILFRLYLLQATKWRACRNTARSWTSSYAIWIQSVESVICFRRSVVHLKSYNPLKLVIGIRCQQYSLQFDLSFARNYAIYLTYKILGQSGICTYYKVRYVVAQFFFNLNLHLHRAIFVQISDHTSGGGISQIPDVFLWPGSGKILSMRASTLIRVCYRYLEVIPGASVNERLL